MPRLPPGRSDWANWLKDLLTPVGLLGIVLEAQRRCRYHFGNASGTFVMRPVLLPGVPPHPRPVEVAIADLGHQAKKFVWERYYESGFAFAGNWDEVIKVRRPSLHERPAPEKGDASSYARRTVIEMFVEGIPPDETSEYRHLAERIARGGRPRASSSLEDLDAHFELLLQDYAAIARGEFGRRQRDGRFVPHLVRVFVDRHGHLIHRSQGMHQLRMAEFCQLTHVPVDILAVHTGWLQPFLARHGGADAAVDAALASLSFVPADSGEAKQQIHPPDPAGSAPDGNQLVAKD